MAFTKAKSSCNYSEWIVKETLILKLVESPNVVFVDIRPSWKKVLDEINVFG